MTAAASQFNGIPACLARFASPERWVAWSGDPKRKAPLSPTGRAASSSDQATSGTFDQVRTVGGGVGIMLSPGDTPIDLVAFDLGDFRDPETGMIDQWALDLINRAGSYTEVTPSGGGLHILGTGAVQEFGGSLDRPNGGHAEVYARTGRYITVSGQHLEGRPTELADVSALFLEHIQEKRRPAGPDPYHTFAQNAHRGNGADNAGTWL